MNSHQRLSNFEFAKKAVAVIGLMTLLTLVSVKWFTENYILGLDFAPIRCLPENVFLIKKMNNFTPVLGDKVAFLGSSDDVYIHPGRVVVKEVKAISGDRIKIKNGELFINSQDVARLDLIKRLKKKVNSFDTEYLVSSDSVFLMGSQPRSFDSRYWGAIKLNRLVGKVIFSF